MAAEQWVSAGAEILRYAYDANSRLTNRWTPAKGATTYRYNVAGSLTNVDYAVSSDITFKYDALQRLTNMVDGVGTTTYSYDGANQLVSEDGPWANDAVSYTYNNRLRSGLSVTQPYSPSWLQSYGYDGAKRLTNVISPAGTFSYLLGGSAASIPLIRRLTLGNSSYITNTYDLVARLSGTYLKNSGHSTLNSHTYDYDVANQRKFMTNTAGNFWAYTYDDIGQLRSAKGKEAGGTDRLNEQLGYKYDAAGNLNQRTNRSLVQTFTVNALNQLSNVTRSGTLTLAGNTYGSASTVTVNGSSATLYGDNTFVKDGVTLTNGANSFTAVGTDASGRTATDSVTATLPTPANMTYDSNGNLTAEGYRLYSYDDENRLTTFEGNYWKINYFLRWEEPAQNTPGL